MKLTIYANGKMVFKTEKATFIEAAYPDGIVDLDNGNEVIAEALDGHEAYARFWNIKLDKEDEKSRSLIMAVFPDIKERVKAEKIKLPENLYKIAVTKLAKDGEKFLNVCGRCGGTGHYNFNMKDGTRCYGCHGLKYKLPSKFSKKWLREIAEFYKEAK